MIRYRVSNPALGYLTPKDFADTKHVTGRNRNIVELRFRPGVPT